MSDFYNGGNGGGGGGGGGHIDPSSIPDEQNIFLATNSKFTNGVPDKGWFQQPIAMFQVAGGANRIWLAALRKEYVISDSNKRPPFLINDSSQASKSRYLELYFESYYSSANHQAMKRFLLLDVGLLANSDDGKFVKIKKISGNIWDYELDTPSSTPELFEVYIDEDDPSKNRNVVYNDILNAVNSGKYVYLKVKDNTGDYVFYSLNDTFSNAVEFIHTTAGGTAFGFHSYLLLDDDTYTHWSDYVYRTNAYIDESVSPPTTLHLLFNDLKYKFNKGSNEDCNIVYTKSNGDKYKLPAVKLTATEIMFSIYDPDTARNLSIVVNDQNQYTVIT